MTQQHLAFVFPGQGSQKIGMLAELAAEYPIVQSTFAEASEVLGYDLWALVQTGSQEEINLTERTQPLLLTASVAVWRVWNQKGGAQPALVAGHSLGEWSALVCAGVVDFKAAVKIVQLRGRYMQEAVPAGVGAMAAIIGLDDELIKDACKKAEQGDVVAAVNFNSPGQVVIAGTAAAVERASALCKEAGAKRALPLPVSAPFHTELMRPAAERLADLVSATVFSVPSIPVVHNVTAATESNPEKIKALMIEQIYSPVRWVDCVNTMVELGATTTIECGPGKVLSGLNKRIAAQLSALSVEKPEELDVVLAAV
ncbi:ACP S-malonyltransferase [Cellvibrio japonicus]|uniref:Malonyl CoA-acyl carrier protein transacylase n=1 Tax=Cellvibrio japonicus (strain Ueda107) TaxID=498211 RepID=B3PEV0_CELJU|nr:ACP S-malonyltransferase [Cellvibrio japonicus]ACE83157.1 malonyl CoA-acyl carrier protein transacylase [Cellvibrio japonicus Ueda107]QEI12197.1 ACP S-malonyltransferase [Cellvibrio japonicus]QEI15771.1 ACP S-malonyltransferase [Cellvibrio japonicus]QEI19349.1 ACP S-malonyltransferase [Cellvibrio japonicus]